MAKPSLLHLGGDIKYDRNQELYRRLEDEFNIVRSYSMSRPDFLDALRNQKFGDFVAVYRPQWATGGEMGKWDTELIPLLPKTCKIYAAAGAGFDWIDTKMLAERGIIYCNSAAACTESVADAALWHILATYRLLAWSARAAHSGDAEQWQEAHRVIPGVTHNPEGSKLGIIGLGRIGQRIAYKAKFAFEMDILYNDIQRLPPDVENATSATYYESLDDMLAVSDCVLLATPFVGARLINRDTISKFKKGAHFVNIARGKLVDEEALADALESGHLAGAGLDVHFDEPNVSQRLAKMHNVLLTCHTAGGSVESHEGFERMGIENILSYFQTGKAMTPVNLEYLKTE